MNDRREAIEILLNRRGSEPYVRLLGSLVVLSAAVVPLNLATNLFFHGDLAKTVGSVLMVVLALWAAEDNRLMEVVNRNRFLELVVLTAIPAADWSDTLAGRSLRKMGLVAAVGLLVNGFVVLVLEPVALVASRGVWPGWPGLLGYVSPTSGFSVLWWLPTVACMTLTVGYAYQLLALYDLGRPGRETQGVLMLAPFVGMAALLVGAWTRQDMLVLVPTVALLGGLRFRIIQRLRQLILGDGKGEGAAPVPAVQTSSLNPIVRREAARVGRHTFGGRVGVLLTRYGVPVVLIGIVCYLYTHDFAVSLDVAGAGFRESILGALLVYALLSIGLTYEHLSHAIFDERSRDTGVLLETTPLSAQTYLSGWMSWAILNRLPGMLILYGFAIAEFISHGMVLDLTDVCLLAVLTLVVIRCSAVSSILISAKDAGRMVAHLEFAVWLFWFLFLGTGAWGLVYLLSPHYALVGPVLLAGALYLGAFNTAVQRLSSESGSLRFLDPWDAI